MIYKQGLETILSGLNEDLKWEYAAAIQYIQHAAMLSGAQYADTIGELGMHADDEFAHAHVLSQLIAYLGGVPTVQAEKRLVSPQSEEILRQDLQGEYAAIRRYQTRIGQLESIGLHDSSQRIRNIVRDEQAHAMDLEVILGISRTQPAIRQTPQANGDLRGNMA